MSIGKKVDKIFNRYFVRRFIYLVFGIWCISYAYSLHQFTPLSILGDLKKFHFIEILIAVILYLLSHTVRVLRLVILNPVTKFNIRDLWREQYKANGVNLLVPFKLGESYRLIYFKKFFGSYSNSFAVLVTERFLDLFTIFVLLSLASYFSGIDIPAIKYLFYISIALLSVICIILYIFDELLIILHKIFLHKQTTKLTITAIEISGSLIRAIKKIKSILHNKYISCLFVSVIIWTLEISAFFIFLDLLEYQLDLLIFLALAVSFATLLPNAPLGYGGLQAAFYLIGEASGTIGLVDYSFVYSIYIFGSGLLVAGYFFLRDFIKGN